MNIVFKDYFNSINKLCYPIQERNRAIVERLVYYNTNKSATKIHTELIKNDLKCIDQISELEYYTENKVLVRIHRALVLFMNVIDFHACLFLRNQGRFFETTINKMISFHEKEINNLHKNKEICSSQVTAFKNIMKILIVHALIFMDNMNIKYHHIKKKKKFYHLSKQETLEINFPAKIKLSLPISKELWKSVLQVKKEGKLIEKRYQNMITLHDIFVS